MILMHKYWLCSLPWLVKIGVLTMSWKEKELNFIKTYFIFHDGSPNGVSILKLSIIFN